MEEFEYQDEIPVQPEPVYTPPKKKKKRGGCAIVAVALACSIFGAQWARRVLWA